MSVLWNSCVLFVLSQVFISVYGNVKITPIAVDNKSNMKSDLKVEEARYQNPIMPEYYDRSSSYYDRNRPNNFVTGGSYSSPTTNYDRYGYNNYDRYSGSSFGGYNKNYGSSLSSMLENKLNYLNGGSYLNNPSSSSYGNRYPYDNNPVLSTGMYPPPPPPVGGAFPHGGGILPPEIEAKTGLLLPLAGAALLGIAAFALISNPGIAMAAGPVAYGKRRKRSLFDEKVDQHMAYRAHHNRK